MVGQGARRQVRARGLMVDKYSMQAELERD